MFDNYEVAMVTDTEREKAPLVWTCGTLQLCSQDSL